MITTATRSTTPPVEGGAARYARLRRESSPLAIVARWHDEMHTGSRKFCGEEPCATLIAHRHDLSQA